MVGVLSGSYPAFFVSAFRSDQIFKGNFGSKLKKQNLRKGLVVVQYVISIAFLSVTLVMFSQLKYLQNRDLGFDRDQVVNISMNVDNLFGFENSLKSAIEKGKKVKTILEQIPGVSSVGFSTNTFNGNTWIRVGSAEKGKEDQTEVLSATFVDPGFIPTLDIQLAEGRNFSEMNLADYKNAVIVNQAMVDHLAWEDGLTGKLPGRYEAHEVIGVVEDFSYEKLHSAVRPLYMCMNPEFMLTAMNQLSMESMIETNMYVKIRGGAVQETLAGIEEEIRALYPEDPFEYTFLDEAIAAQYERERNTNRIISTATFLAILISCLGLFGLSLLTLNARVKELGIRKVMGASFGIILRTLVKDYIIMIILATVVAVPLAYYAVSRWIREFEFRIDITPQYFVTAAFLTLVLAMLTVSYLAVKAAMTKPAEALRYE
jgi:putative ABC transport system permease protein